VGEQRERHVGVKRQHLDALAVHVKTDVAGNVKEE
jgi:hypothetical protein